jgi:hypothetical protein
MAATIVFNLIASIVVVAGLAAVCRSAYVVSGRRNEELAPLETSVPRELDRAA